MNAVFSKTLGELTQLLDGILLTSGAEKLCVQRLQDDSRRKVPESIFVAYKGEDFDSHLFVPQAVENGAVAAVVTDPSCWLEVPAILVSDGRRALSKLSALYFGDPSESLKTIGITGTNGKTTVHWLCYHALAELDLPGIRIGSLGIEAGKVFERSGKVRTKDAGEILLTTPGAYEIQSSLREAVDRGLTTCVLETSSHALVQHRVADIDYDVALFTNLTPDHLNFHRDIEDYFSAKVQLFEQLAQSWSRQSKSIGGAVVNVDCPYGRRLSELVAGLAPPLFRYGTHPSAEVRIHDFEQALQGSMLRVSYQGERYDIRSSFFGEYNGSNLAGSFAALVALGCEPSRVASVLSHVPAAPGRLEFVGNEGMGVFVDYAHTGTGLLNVLSAIRPFAQGDLWVLFGCGGGKDPRKRQAMGDAAQQLADKIVITNDNPKKEDPSSIIEDILSSGCQPEFVEHDRRTAIERTLRTAKRGDVVLLAGKGHEDYQIIGDETFYFSDREEVLALRERGVF